MNTMKFLVSLLLLVAVGSNVGPKVYNFRLKNLNNNTVSYKELKGENLTVIDFWATWCKPCVRSIPKLVEMHDEFSDKGVHFIGISVDGPRNLAKVKPFAKSLGVDYTVLLDTENEVMQRLRVQSVPTLLIINSNDEVVYFTEGYVPGEEKLIRKEILKHLDQ